MNGELTSIRRAGWLVFLLGAVVIGGTVAGPGLTWDEPAYRGSQVGVQEWWGELVRSGDVAMLGKEQIDHYWEYNRFGPNFHPPMASYFNFASYLTFGWLIDDLSARRLASALQFAALAGILTRFLGKRWGLLPGVFAGLSLLFMPRLVGDAHVVGTDVTMLFFWTITALLFWKSLEEPRWRWWFGFSAGCLFLTKFSGLVLVVPLALWFLSVLWVHRHWLGTWLSISLQLFVPLLPIAIAVLGGEKLAVKSTLMGSLAKFVFEHDRLFFLLLLWPALRLSLFRRHADWPRVLEIPWAALAVAPLVAVALNPTWWHDSIAGLARYFDLNLHREGKLPNIGVFYLGERYSYSLPWHNGIVLLLVTVPFGVLLLGLFGGFKVVLSCAMPTLRGHADAEQDPNMPTKRGHGTSLGVFVLLQTLTLIVFRMFPTPAHDGVRLFLPTFLFFAALAAYGAMLLGRNHPERLPTLLLVGPILSAAEWAWIHPLELSYYNIGLRNAFKLGFEATYWYDAVTPKFLQQLNESLPPNANLVVQVDELINPEVLFSLQSMGRLRKDINLQPPEGSLDNWVLLLTHSSKATPFTKLLYAVSRGNEFRWEINEGRTDPRGLEYRHDGVRLVSLMSPRDTPLVLTVLSLATVRGQMSTSADGVVRLEKLTLFEPAFDASWEDWREALIAFKEGGSAGGKAQALLDHCRNNPFARHYLPKFIGDERLMKTAVHLLTDRRVDVRLVLTTPGYVMEERFGNWLPEVTKWSPWHDRKLFR